MRTTLPRPAPAGGAASGCPAAFGAGRPPAACGAPLAARPTLAPRRTLAPRCAADASGDEPASSKPRMRRTARLFSPGGGAGSTATTRQEEAPPRRGGREAAGAGSSGRRETGGGSGDGDSGSGGGSGSFSSVADEFRKALEAGDLPAPPRQRRTPPPAAAPRPRVREDGGGSDGDAERWGRSGGARDRGGGARDRGGGARDRGGGARDRGGEDGPRRGRDDGERRGRSSGGGDGDSGRGGGTRARWEAEAAEREELAAKEERRRALAKKRSERIPEAPKPNQDPVVFQALTREWDPRATREERRGARAAARKVVRVAIEDPNKNVRKLRWQLSMMAAGKAQRAPPKALAPLVDVPAEELAARAARAAAQVEAASASSIQKSKEEIARQAAGVKRSFERAEALPEGEWERLKRDYISMDKVIKIGRRGATAALVSAVQSFWRGSEVVKLVVHDDKSARKMNLPRFNVLLQELEEMTGGVLVNTSGKSIWLYRGVDWKPAPVEPPHLPPPVADQLTQEHEPRGSWVELGGVACYVVEGAGGAPLASSEGGSGGGEGSSGESSSGGGGGGAQADAPMAVLMLPDMFPMANQQLLMQVADRVAAKGALVVLADMLGPEPSSPQGSVATRGAGIATSSSGYWKCNFWPLVKARKLEFMEWYTGGAGSWVQQRPRLLRVVEAMREAGMHGGDGGGGGGGEGRPLGALGLGWGSYLAMRAAGDEAFEEAGLRAAAAMSPTTFGDDIPLANALRLPVALLPAKYDSMDQMAITLDLLLPPFYDRCVFKRFGKVKPGWASWLPQWIDRRAMMQAAEQLLMATAFLRRELLGVPDASLPPPAKTEVVGGGDSGGGSEGGGSEGGGSKGGGASDEEAEEAEAAEE